jgi:hypothetical protein
VVRWKGAQKRLRELLRFRPRKDYADLLLKAAGETPDPLPLDNPNLWILAARSALTISPDDTVLKRAFDALKLDPKNPFNWRELAQYLAHLLFDDSKKGGRRSEWDTERYCKLLKAVHKRQQANSHLSDAGARRLIAQDKASPVYFRRSGKEGLRKKLREARSPEHNEVVRMLVERAIPIAKFQAELRGGDWSKVEKEWVTETAKLAAQFVASKY